MRYKTMNMIKKQTKLQNSFFSIKVYLLPPHLIFKSTKLLIDKKEHTQVWKRIVKMAYVIVAQVFNILSPIL